MSAFHLTSGSGHQDQDRDEKEKIKLRTKRLCAIEKEQDHRVKCQEWNRGKILLSLQAVEQNASENGGKDEDENEDLEKDL